MELEKAKAEKESLRQAATLAVETAKESVTLAKQALALIEKTKAESNSLALAESLAKQQQENAAVVAPIDGTVIKIHSKAGDKVANLPLMEVADLSKMCVEAEVFFANLNEVKVGQKAIIKSPALPKDIHAEVLSIGTYFGNSLLQSPNPLALADQETAKVKLAIQGDDVEERKQLLSEISAVFEAKSKL